MEEEKTISKGIDLATKELQEGLMFVINSSGLPPVIIKFVLNDLLNQTKSMEKEAVKIQFDAFSNEIRKQNEKTKNEEEKNTEKS